MASLIDRKTNYWIQFTAQDGKRKTFRLGHYNKKLANQALYHIEEILNSLKHGVRITPDIQAWINRQTHLIKSRLTACGLLAETVSTLGELVSLVRNRRTDLKPATQRTREQSFDSLLRFFGQDKNIGTITRSDAEEYKQHLFESGSIQRPGRGLAKATVTKHCKDAACLLNFAIDNNWLDKNPFKGLKLFSQKNSDRLFFVTRNLIDPIINDAEPWFALVLALARYGGLRCPSEIKPLRQDWINWQEQTIKIYSPKTEHHEGKDFRLIPIFPELKNHLREALKRNQHQELLIPELRQTRAALFNRLTVLQRKHQVLSWPKAFQNLRSTRQTELVEEFPTHVVCGWLGNSEKVAEKHYLQITKEHFLLAASGLKKLE